MPRAAAAEQLAERLGLSPLRRPQVPDPARRVDQRSAATAGRTSRRRAASRTRPARAGARGRRARPRPRAGGRRSARRRASARRGAARRTARARRRPARWRARWRMSASSTARIASHHGAIARSQYSAIRSTSAGSARGRVVEQRARDGRHLAALERPPELEPHLLGRGRAHARELLLDVRQRRQRRRSDEVRARTGRSGAARRSASSRARRAGRAPRAPTAGGPSGAPGSRSTRRLAASSNSGEIAKRVRSRSSRPKR